MAVLHGRAVIAVSDVAVKLASTPTAASWITIQPLTDEDGNGTNVGAVFLGAVGITRTAGGFCLNAGDSAVAWPAGVQIYPYDLSQIYIVGDNVADGVQFIYGA